MYFPKYGMMVSGRIEPGTAGNFPGLWEGQVFEVVATRFAALVPAFFPQMSDIGEPFKPYRSVCLLADMGMRV